MTSPNPVGDQTRDIGDEPSRAALTTVIAAEAAHRWLASEASTLLQQIRRAREALGQ